MKKYILNDSLNSKMLTNHEERILKLEESFNKLSAKQNSIIYEGCIYDSRRFQGSTHFPDHTC